MTAKDKKRERRIIIAISGDVLKAAMGLRAKSERESGEPTSLTAVVNAAVLAQRDKVEEVEGE